MGNVHSWLYTLLLAICTPLAIVGIFFVVSGIMNEDNEEEKELGKDILIVIIALATLLQYLD